MLAKVWYRFTDIDYLNMAKANKWSMKKAAEMFAWITIEDDPKFENLTTAVKFCDFDFADRGFKDQLSGVFYRVMDMYLYSLYCGHVWEDVDLAYLRDLACQPKEIDRLTDISITREEALVAIERTVPGLADKARKYLSGEIRVGRDDNLKKHIYEEYASEEVKSCIEKAKSRSKSEGAAELAKSRNERERAIIRGRAESVLDDGCRCWHKLISKRVYADFLEQGQVDEKGKVFGVYAPKGVTDIVREVYKSRNLDDLIYDLQKHGGVRNRCEIHTDIR